MPSIIIPSRNFFIAYPDTSPSTLAIYVFSILLDGCVNLFVRTPSLVKIINPVVSKFGLTGDVISLALMKPISGTASIGLATSIMQTYGPDSYIGRLASTMQGASDTTMYIIAVYFGSVGITKVKHSLWAGLTSDFLGFLASIVACRLIFG